MSHGRSASVGYRGSDMIGRTIYMTGSTDPWYVKPSDPGSPDAALNRALGAGNWSKDQGFTTTAIDSGTAFLYIDGGYQTSTAFDTFMTKNVLALQNYVSKGGVLFLNASRYDTADQALGFGVTLKHGYSPSATAVVANSLVFNGPNGATGTNFTGGYFANDTLSFSSDSGFQTLLNGTAGAVLGYEKYGAGMVIFGSMSDPKYDLPLAQAETLRANIISFGDNAFVPVVAAALPATVEINQTTIVATVTAFQPVDTLVLSKTSGTGSLSLVNHADGTYDVVYTAPSSIAASVIDNLGYTVTDTSHATDLNVASGTAAVQLDRGPVVTGGVVAPGTVEFGQFIKIGTVTAGLSGDTLSVLGSTAMGTVTISAASTNGVYTVLYQAPSSVPTSVPDTFSYVVTDQHNDVKPSAAATVQLDAGPKVVAVQANPLISTGTIEIGQTITLGTVTAGIATDTLAIVATAGGGSVALVPTATAGVETIVYTATQAGVNLLDAVSYSITDQYSDAMTKNSALVQLDKGPSIGPAPSFTVGHGLSYVLTLDKVGATPGLAGDTLSFSKSSALIGTVSFAGPIDTYTATNVTVPTTVALSYTIADQHSDVTQTGVATVMIDPGAAALNLTGSVTVGKSVVLGTVTPGLAGDVLKMTTTGAEGHLTMAADGTLTYVADGGAAYGTIPSLGSVSDAFTYTVTDQWGDTVTRNIAVKVNNIINYITGPVNGGGTTHGGVVGDNVVTLTAFNNNVVLYTGSDVVTGGDSGTTITKASGDLVAHIRGFYDSITSLGVGNHTIDGSASQITVNLGAGDNTIAFDGFNNVITAGAGTNLIYQTTTSNGNNTVTLGDGTQTVVIGGFHNVIKVGNNTGTGFTFINAGPGGDEAVTAGDGNNYILAGGYRDVVTVGNHGTDVIFATGTSGSLANPPGTPAAVPSTGVVNSGVATITLGTVLGTDTDNFVFLGGTSNVVFLGSSTGGHLNTINGGNGLDSYVVAANGGNSVFSTFQLVNGDKIDLSRFLTSAEFASLSGHVVFTAGTTANDQVMTVTGAAGSAMLDLYGTAGASHATLLSHLSFGH